MTMGIPDIRLEEVSINQPKNPSQANIVLAQKLRAVVNGEVAGEEGFFRMIHAEPSLFNWVGMGGYVSEKRLTESQVNYEIGLLSAELEENRALSIVSKELYEYWRRNFTEKQALPFFKHLFSYFKLVMLSENLSLKVIDAVETYIMEELMNRTLKYPTLANTRMSSLLIQIASFVEQQPLQSQTPELATTPKALSLRDVRIQEHYQALLPEINSRFERIMKMASREGKIASLRELQIELEAFALPIKSTLYDGTMEFMCRSLISKVLLPKVTIALAPLEASKNLHARYDQIEQEVDPTRNIHSILDYISFLGGDAGMYIPGSTARQVVFTYMTELQVRIEKLEEDGIFDAELKEFAWYTIYGKLSMILRQVVNAFGAKGHTLYLHNDPASPTVENTEHTNVDEYKAFAWLVSELISDIFSFRDHTISMIGLKDATQSDLFSDLHLTMGKRFLQTKIGELPEPEEA
jgi:hypothetical protein